MYKSWGSKLLLDIILFICQLKLFKSPRLEKYSNCCSNKFSPRDSANLLFLLYVCTNKINFGWGKKIQFSRGRVPGALLSQLIYRSTYISVCIFNFHEKKLNAKVQRLWTKKYVISLNREAMSFYPSLCSMETSSRKPSLLYL